MRVRHVWFRWNHRFVRRVRRPDSFCRMLLTDNEYLFVTNSTEQLSFDDVPVEPVPPPQLFRFRQIADFGPESPAAVSVTKAAQLLGISRTTAYEAVRDGSLPAIRVRRRIVVPMSWLDDTLRGRPPPT